MYIIKPDGMARRLEIRDMIEQSSLVVVRSATAILPVWVVEVIYPDLSEERCNTAIHYMTCDECEVGILSGNDAVRRFLNLAGEFVEPGRCEPGSIRAKFGTKDPLQGWYYNNAIHRPTNQYEAVRDLAIAYQLI